MPADRCPSDLAARTLVCLLLIAAVVCLVGLGVAATSAGHARAALRFGFGGVERSAAGTARITAHNAGIALGIVLAAGVWPHAGLRSRAFLDVVVIAVLTLNAGAIGVALGAYGPRVVTALAPHAPLELGAFSLAGGTYAHARACGTRVSTLAVIAAGCLALLAFAAALETYISLGAAR